MFSLRQANRLTSSASPLIRTFTRTSVLPAKPLPPRLKIDDADVSISYVKGTGPGGQKINKTSSAVQITHAPSGLVVKCQATRSQAQNRKIARSLLADRVEHMEKGDESRVSLKAKAAQKKKASKMKKSRRKYRALEKAKEEEKNENGELYIEGDNLPEQKEDIGKH
ncbi:peptide chain release factor-like protein [Penicillium taxi]|uniref:peptide chain release factor-like protein n=1 Tax=Penicillium taxi TaxID=168475 RepID=UPI0025459843|nr:peptide chain release factor-like protein [Penicillium taxi]KAJ5887645.1 peptide chain release factor-like protein [Penicillium taxi]